MTFTVVREITMPSKTVVDSELAVIRYEYLSETITINSFAFMPIQVWRNIRTELHKENALNNPFVWNVTSHSSIVFKTGQDILKGFSRPTFIAYMDAKNISNILCNGSTEFGLVPLISLLDETILPDPVKWSLMNYRSFRFNWFRSKID